MGTGVATALKNAGTHFNRTLLGGEILRYRDGRRCLRTCLLGADQRQEVLIANFLIQPDRRFIELNGNNRWA